MKSTLLSRREVLLGKQDTLFRIFVSMAKSNFLCRTTRPFSLYLATFVSFSLPLPKQTDVTCLAYDGLGPSLPLPKVGYAHSGMNSSLDAVATLFGRSLSPCSRAKY